MLSQLKLIAEPWDVGEGGYQVGNFPVRWAEWNGRYRDAVRALWRGDGGKAAEIGYRLTGSSDLYEANGRRALGQHQPDHRPRRLHAARPGQLQPQAQRGQRRGQPRRQRPRALSWNCGVEGPTDDRGVNAPAPPPAAQPARHHAALAGHAHAGGRRRVRPHAARQQQRLLPGQRAQLVRLGLRRRAAAAVRVHAAAAAHPARPPGAAPLQVLPERAIHGTDLHDLLWFRHDGERDVARGLEQSRHQELGDVPGRARHRRCRRAGPSAGRRQPAAADQRQRARPPFHHSAAARPSTSPGSVLVDTARRRRRERRLPAGRDRHAALRARSSFCCALHHA